MFKGIIPHKRVVSVGGPNLPDAQGEGKENNRPTRIHDALAANGLVPARKSFSQDTAKAESLQDKERPRMKKKKSMFLKEKEKEKDNDPDTAMMEKAFSQLLDNLQIPNTVRIKLDTMEPSVKSAMLRSSNMLTNNGPPAAPPTMTDSMKTPHLRRTRSTESLALGSPASGQSASLHYDFPRPPPILADSPLRGSMTPPASPSRKGNSSVLQSLGHHRGISLGSFGSRSQVNLGTLSGSNTTSKKQKDGKPAYSKEMAPQRYCNVLSGVSSLEIDVEAIKKLRLLLRNESANWTEEFIDCGGYDALLTRLNEILEVEWREEQHDDQALHELLRCFKALTTSGVGCDALRSAGPMPFNQLVKLLYSDKKPGDVATRQLITELLLNLFDLYPPSALPLGTGKGPAAPRQRRREVWEGSEPLQGRRSTDGLVFLPSPHNSIFSFIRSLLLTPAPRPAEGPETPLQPHEFIESLHIPRIYKTYLRELSDVCRDYFWVFCHPSNVIWNLDDTDEAKVEKPRAPGGMTGGVEFEAMTYLTTHYKFLNAVAKAAADLKLPKSNELSAHRFHADLFASGFERIIMVSRKASTVYYPTLHLEIARYVALAGQAGFELPWTLSRAIAPPPAVMCKPGRAPAKDRAPTTPKGQKGQAMSGAPRLPTPQKTERLKMD